MKKNNQFSSSIGFIAASLGSAVGLGQIWRFPYEVGQYGGAAFLLVYLLFTVFLGMPMMIVETAFGRARQGGTHSAYAQAGFWKSLGWIAAIGAFFTMSFYNVVTGWILGYTVELLRGNLLASSDIPGFFTAFTQDVPSNLCYTLLVSVLVAGVIRAGVSTGIERFSKVLMPLLVLMMIGLIGYGLTLSGAQQGISFYLVPRLSDLSPQAVATALSQAFMGLGIGPGILVTFGSYLPKETNLLKSAFFIVLGVVVVSFLAGFIIFPFIFHQGLSPAGGPGLVFMSLPTVFQQFAPFWGKLLGGAFFLLLLFAAVTSGVSVLAVSINHAIERWGWSRNRATLVVGSATFLMGIPSLLSAGASDFFTHFITLNGRTYDFIGAILLVVQDSLFPLAAIFLSRFMAKRWDTYALTAELQHGTPLAPWLLAYLRMIAGYVAPLLIGGIFIGNMLGLMGLV